MSDRTINFGESETEATYQIQDTDSTGGGNFVVAKDTNANTVLLQYDPDTDTWEYAADVDMNGGNVSGVGTLTAESVNTEEAQITGHTDLKVTLSENQSIPSGSGQTLELDTIIEDNLSEFNTTSHEFSPVQSGKYLINIVVSFRDLSSSDELSLSFRDDQGNNIAQFFDASSATGGFNRHSVGLLTKAELESTRDYNVRVLNNDSSCGVNAGEVDTWLEIARSPVGAST